MRPPSRTRRRRSPSVGDLHCAALRGRDAGSACVGRDGFAHARSSRVRSPFECPVEAARRRRSRAMTRTTVPPRAASTRRPDRRASVARVAAVGPARVTASPRTAAGFAEAVQRALGAVRKREGLRALVLSKPQSEVADELAPHVLGPALGGRLAGARGPGRARARRGLGRRGTIRGAGSPTGSSRAASTAAASSTQPSSGRRVARAARPDGARPRRRDAHVATPPAARRGGGDLRALRRGGLREAARGDVERTPPPRAAGRPRAQRAPARAADPRRGGGGLGRRLATASRALDDALPRVAAEIGRPVRRSGSRARASRTSRSRTSSPARTRCAWRSPSATTSRRARLGAHRRARRRRRRGAGDLRAPRRGPQHRGLTPP